ncbi:MAG: hypothetical protein ACTS2F_13555 [Thainema sp.]
MFTPQKSPRPKSSKYLRAALWGCLGAVLVSFGGCALYGAILWNAWGPGPRWGETSHRTLNFVTNQPIGELYVIQDANCFTCAYEEKPGGTAQGTVQVEVPDFRWYVLLIVSSSGATQLRYLQNIKSGDIEVIDLSDTSVTDADLQFISHLELNELNLDNTNITGSGLESLVFSNSSFSLSLENCQNLNKSMILALKKYPAFSLDLSNSNLDQPDIIEELHQAFCSGLESGQCHKTVRGDSLRD